MYQNAPSPLQINKAETLLNERNNGAILSHYLDVNYIKSNKNECFMFSVNGCKLFDECHTNPNLRKIIDILREAGMRISNQGIGNEFTLKTLESAILKTNG